MMDSGWIAVLGVVGTCLVFFAPIAYDLWVPERWKSRREPRCALENWDEWGERQGSGEERDSPRVR